MSRRTFPPASLLALLLIGLSFTYLIGSETPRGQVQGIAVLNDAGGKPLSECDVYLTPSTLEGAESPKNDTRERRHVVTDKAGKFTLRGVPAGNYTISGSSRWHKTDDETVYVEEGQTASATLTLFRSEADLSISDHQATFATAEKPFLPVRGYTSLPDAKGKKATVRVQIWQTKLSQVLPRADASADLDKLRYSYNGNQSSFTPALLHPDPAVATPPRKVADTIVPITNVDREGFFVNRLSLAAAQGKPGLYLVKFTSGKQSSCSYVMVTDLALLVKRAKQQVVGYTAHIQKGTPVAGATLRIIRQGQTLTSGTSDARGITNLSLPGAAASADNNDDTPTLTMAFYGSDEAVVSRFGYGGYGDENAGEYVVHTVTDRTIYRPGDTIQFKGIVRQHRDLPDAAPAYAVPRNLPVSVEIRDASGGLLAREDKTTNNYGTFHGSIKVSSEGATGTYTLVTRVAGETHTSEVQVASYRKPEFAVTVTPSKARYVRGDTVEMTLDAAYYFGAPVAGAKVHYYLYRDADWQAEYGQSDDEDEGDYSRYSRETYGAYYGETVDQGDITLDENGKATIRVPTSTRRPKSYDGEKDAKEKEKEENAPLPQAETYTLTAEVTDDAKRSVSAEGEARVGAGDILLRVSPEGYVANVGKPSQVFVTVRDPQGKPLPNMSVSLASTYDQYVKEQKETVTRTLGAPQTATTGPDGRALFTVTPRRAAELRLTAIAQDAAGRTVRAEGNVWATGSRDDDLDTDYGDLSLLTDKRRYAPGDTAHVLVNASRTGQTVLLSVEGDRVYQTLTVPVRKRSTLAEILIRPEWGPNVVLVGNYVRDKKFASSETPLRVDVRARQLAVRVEPVGGTKYQPGANVTYTVRTTDRESGKPVSTDFALSVVDESIYALREDDPKVLKRTFYPPRTNRVSTSFSFSVEYLGDVNKAEPQIKARRKFRDTAYWQADGHTDATGQATLTVTLPDNLTTWRATVNAVSDETAVGYGMGKIVVSKPFFVRLETPRFLTGTDASRLLALVHNETGQAQQVQVRLVAPSLKIDSEETQSLTVAAGAVGQAQWNVTSAANASGDAPLRVTAWTAKEAGREPFTDGIEQTVPVRAYGRTRITTFAGVLDIGTNPSEAGNARFGNAPGVVSLTQEASAIPQETRVSLRIAPSVKAALTGSVEYLAGFPYGCTEQTMSRFYPDLLMQNLGLLNDSRKQEQLPRLVRDGVARLARFQHGESGAWGWWEHDGDDPFLTAYALIGLSTAKARGYTVDDALLERGRKAASKFATTASIEERPFLLYALSEAGYGDQNLLRAPFRESGTKTKLVPAKLPNDALAYLCLLGRKQNLPYRPFYNELQRRAKWEGRLVHWQGVKYDSNSTDRMATALAVRVMLAQDPNDVRITAALRWLMNSRTDGYFGNTRDTAWVLFALCDYLRVHPEDADPTGVIDIRVNGKSVRTLDLATEARGEPEISVTLPANVLHTGHNELRLVRGTRGGSAGAIFYSGALKQTLGAPDGGELPPFSDSDVTVRREVLRVLPRKTTDNFWTLATEPAENGRFKQGDQLRVRLVITANREMSYVLIEDFFPSGAEVTERGTAEEEVGDNDSGSFWYDHVDVRDDRIAFFARKMPKGKHVLEYNLRAQTPGTSRALPANVQGMYDPEAHGESGTTRLEVQP